MEWRVGKVSRTFYNEILSRRNARCHGSFWCLCTRYKGTKYFDFVQNDSDITQKHLLCFSLNKASPFINLTQEISNLGYHSHSIHAPVSNWTFPGLKSSQPQKASHCKNLTANPPPYMKSKIPTGPSDPMSISCSNLEKSHLWSGVWRQLPNLPHVIFFRSSTCSSCTSSSR